MSFSEDWKSCSHLGYINIGTHEHFASIAGPDQKPSDPLVIAFVGAGDRVEYWAAIQEQVSQFARILLFDSVSGCPWSTHGGVSLTTKRRRVAKELSTLLRIVAAKPPYLLVANCFSSCTAREFLYHRKPDIAGMVIVEDEVRTQCSRHHWDLDSRLLKNRPLSSIVTKKGAAHQRVKKVAVDESVMLEKATFDKATSERTKFEKTLSNEAYETMGVIAELENKAPLQTARLHLSSNSRLVDLYHCGYCVHRFRPRVLVHEIRWVLDELVPPFTSGALSGLLNCRILRWLRTICRKN